MNTPEQVFELIKSLSQAEKRFFKMESSKYNSQESPDYWQLYEWIEKQDVYDEEKLKKAFKGKKWLSRLASVKNYLYNQILNALTIFHAENKSIYQVSWLLQQVDILFARGLYKHARKLLNKAKKIAQEYQIKHFLLPIYSWEYQFTELSKQPWGAKSELERIATEERDTLADLQLRIQTERLHEQTVQYMYEKGTPRTEEEQKGYQDFLRHPLLEKPMQTNSWYIRDLRLSIIGMAYYMLMDKKKASDFSMQRILNMETVPHILLEKNRDYWVAVFNMIQTLYAQNRYDEAAALLEKAKSFLAHPKLHLSKRSEEFIFLLIHYHTPRIWMVQGKFEEIVAMSADTLKEYQEWDSQEHKNRVLFMIPMTISAAHFVLGRHEEASDWIRLILNDTSNSVRYDVLGMARILHLLLQYELKNHRILEYYLDSAQRFIKEHQNMYEFEQLFLRFVRQIMQTNQHDKKFKTLVQGLKTNLLRFMEEECFEKQCIQRYHLISWLDSKLEKRAMVDIVQERIKRGERC